MSLAGKKILVTGGLGFIGSHFVESLLDYNTYEKCTQCDIDILDNYSYCVSKKTEEFLKNRADISTSTLNIIKGDVSTYEISEDYDYVVNFAAQSHVDRSIESGDDFVKTNVNGVYNLLNQVMMRGHKTRFVQIGTDEVYGSLGPDDKPSVERDILAPSSVYSSTKASADLIALSMHKTHNMDVVVTRCCNNFGTRQYPEKLIPVVINKLLNGKKIPVYGTGKNTRQWIHVSDHCDQIFNVMVSGNSGEIYNIAPRYIDNISKTYIPCELTNVEIIERVASIVLNNEVNLDQYFEYVEDRKGHDWRYRLNGMRSRYLSKSTKGAWTRHKMPEKTLDNDLRDTIMWYVDNQDWWNEETANS